MEINILVLCLVIALCAYAVFARANGETRPERFPKGSRLYILLVAGIFAVAVGIRVYQFGGVPSGLNQDGAMAAVDANALAHYGTDRFGMKFPAYFTAWGYGQMSILMSVLMVPFIKLFGLTIVTARLPMLLASIAGLVVLFLFVKKVLGRTPALVVLAFAAINPWHIMQSRWALECNLLPHMLLFSVYFLYLGLEKKPFLYVSMVSFGLTMYTYGIAFYTVPLLMIVLCVYLLAKKRIKPWEAALSALVYLAVAWPIFAVVAVNMFKLQTFDAGYITIPYFSDSIRTRDLILFSNHFGAQLVDNLRSLINMAFLEKGDFNWSFIPGYGHMYLFTLPFVLTGIWVLFRKRKAGAALQSPQDGVALSGPSAQVDPTARFMLAAWFAVAMFSGLMVNNVNTNRINIIFYPMIVLASLGIWHVIRQTAHMRRAAIAVALVYTLSFAGFTAYYFGDHAKALAVDFCSGLTDAIKYADGLDSDVLYITSYSRDPTAFSCSEIYTLFGADIDARYFRGEAQATGKNGKPLLPYKQRYLYVNFATSGFNQPLGSVFVYNAQEESYLFDSGEYDTRIFGRFGVAVKTADYSAQYGDPDEPEDQDQTWDADEDDGGADEGAEQEPPVG